MDPRKKAVIISTTQLLVHDYYNIEHINRILLNILHIVPKIIDTRKLKSRRQDRASITCVEHFIGDGGTFQMHFRMTRATFESLLRILGPELDSGRKAFISISTQILITLWVLATPDSFRSVAKRFNISKGSAHYVYVKTIRALTELRLQFIKWPSDPEIKNIQTNIERKSKFPHVVGCIDGMHINIRAPKQSFRYFNRKKTTSLILQAVCDDHLQFTDVYFGEVGSLHDSRVFIRSPLSRKLMTDTIALLGTEGHILGDSAYPLRPYLLTPFRNNGHLTDEENIYNLRHSAVRSVIERSFGLLKGKWRRLKFLDASIFEYIVEHVMACCVLHNFVIKEEKINMSDIDVIDEEFVINAVEELDMDNQPEAVQKRNSIAALLYELEYY